MDFYEKRHAKRRLIKNNRKYLKPLTRCRRFELPITIPWKSSSGAIVPEDLRLAVLKQDPGVELLWHPQRCHWEMYRVKARGGCPANDLMIHEFTIKAPLGFWLINHMQAFDNWTKPTNHYINSLEAQEEKEEVEWERKEEDFLSLVRTDYNNALKSKQWFSFGQVKEGSQLPGKIILPFTKEVLV